MVARGEVRGVGVTYPHRLLMYIIEPVRRRLEEEYIGIRNICVETIDRIYEGRGRWEEKGRNSTYSLYAF